MKEIPKWPAHILILRVTCFFWLIAKFISWKLWLANRLFPLVPPVEILHVPAIIHLVLFVCSLTILSFILIFPHKKYLLLLLLLTEIFSCAFDQNRWQPWEYQYLFIVFVTYLHKTERLIASVACILVATYLYSGINKLNSNFLLNVWSNLILKHYLQLSDSYMHNRALYFAGYILPAIEMFGAVALFFVQTRKFAAFVLIAMHLFNLIVLGPFGLQYNKVVWPWNIAMIFFLCLIFINQKAHSKIVWKNTNVPVAFCWLILPALSFVGRWDNYLSCNLYSGNLPQMIICLKGNVDSVTVKKYFNKQNSTHICDGGYTLNIQKWAMAEMNVPAYPEERIYQLIKQDWQRKYPSSNALFFIKHRQNLLHIDNLFTSAGKYEDMQ